MDNKSRLIQKLLKVAKRHKILTYPVLALVAVISVISNLFSWSTGAGKRVVAVIMVMVMLVSQSYFLTSSATEAIDDEETALVQAELQEEVKSTEESTESPKTDNTVEKTTEASTEVASNTDDKKDTTEAVSEDIIEEENMNSGTSEEQVAEGEFAVPEAQVADAASADGGSADSNDVIDDEEIDSKLAPNQVTIRLYYTISENSITGDVNTAIDKNGDSDTYNGATAASTALAAYDGDDKASTGYGRYTFEGADWYYCNPDGTTGGKVEDLTSLEPNYTPVGGDPEILITVVGRLNRYFITISNDVDTDDDKNTPCTVTAGNDGTSVTASSASGTSGYLVTINKSGDTSINLSGFEKYGYDISSATIGTATYNAGDNSINNIKLTSDANISLNWTGKEYKVKFSTFEFSSTESAVQIKTYHFGAEDVLPTHGNVGVPDKTGKEFNKWQIDSSTGALYDEGLTISGALESALFDGYNAETGDMKIFYPTYKDANVSIEGVANEETLTYTYGVPKNTTTIKAIYSYIDPANRSAGTNNRYGNFTYNLTSTGSNAQTALAAVGVNVVVDNSKGEIYISTDSATGPTGTVSAQTVEFTATDNNNPTADPYPFKFYVTVEKRQILIDTSQFNLYKTYDGTREAKNIPSQIPTKDTEGNSTPIVISITGTSMFDSKDVDTASKIDIPGVNGVTGTNKLVDTSGALSDDQVLTYYTWEAASITGCSIRPRKLYIDTKTKTDDLTILAGTATPSNDQFEIALTSDTDYNNDEVSGFASGESLSILGGITYTITPERDIEAETEELLNKTSERVKKYEINVPEVFSENSNYIVKQVVNKGTFTVKMEDPILDTNYEFGGDKETGVDDWYVNNGKVIAKGDYDTVYIYRDGVRSDTGDLEESDSNNKNMEIQLYNSNTHAITSKKHIDVSYDVTKPEYRGYEIIGFVDEDDNPVDYDYTKKGLYFPNGGALDFGTYTKSEITVRVKYFDNTSGPATLKYGLFGDTAMSQTPVIFEGWTSTGDKIGYADITVYREALKNTIALKGAITCQAIDAAGNKSEPITLKPKDVTGDYDWVVEQAAPDLSRLVVNASSANDNAAAYPDEPDVRSVTVNNSDSYYNNCMATFNVDDSASGIERVEWYINGVNTEEDTIEEHSGFVGSKEYSRKISGISGKVTVKAKVYDNAGNEAETNEVSFFIDDVEPLLDVKYDDKIWTNETNITFTTSDDLSGVDYAKVTDAEGNTIDCNLGKPDALGQYTASFNAITKGVYTVVVADKAGNTAVWNKNIDKISTVVPPCPEITINPESPNSKTGWYNAESTAPKATITNTLLSEDGVPVSEDGTPVTTKYRLWKEGESAYNDTEVPGKSVVVPINDEGVFNIKAWSKSISNVECEDYDKHVKVVKVDRTAPDIDISTEKGTGSTVIVHFAVTDAVSGVDPTSIIVEHGEEAVEIKKEETNEGIVGTFEIDEVGDYNIIASDIAGNKTDENAFTPMSMKVKAVTNITETGATIGANAFKGTYDVTSMSIAYRKYVNDTYTEAETLYNYDDTTGVATVSTDLSGLEPGTAYVFKVTATAEGDEVLEYEGYFKTLATGQTGITIEGTASYNPEKDGYITVGIYDGNVCIMAEEIEAGEKYSFVNVPNGNYSIIATDGTYSKTVRLLIEDGQVQYPTQPTDLDLVLSGMNTSVVITTESTPAVTADEMESIFDNDSNNFTEEDKALIKAGGTVEFKLVATITRMSNLTEGEISAVNTYVGDKEIGALLDLSLYKYRKDKDGNSVGQSPSEVHVLQNPAHISVTIPLGDLAGKPDLEIIRIHNEGENFLGSSLSDEDSNPSTYTISTNQFSTYAIVFGKENEETPTTQQPTTANNNATTQAVDVNIVTPTNPAQTVTQPVVTVQTSDDSDDDDEDVKEIKDKTTKAKASGTTSVGSLTSSGSAKTGDETPIAIMFGFMMFAICGVVVLRKKSKEIN